VAPDLRRGSLDPPSEAPPTGERFRELAAAAGARIEHITSSASPEPITYRQDHDEWVVVLAGGAELDVGGEPVELAPGDWVVLPAHVPHRVTRTVAGTSWLAVHLPEP
jgi:cupin 2 domain-containing protein